MNRPPPSCRPVGPGFWRKWWTCSRPYSLSAALIPVLFGAVMALGRSPYSFQALTFALSLLAMVLLQAGANILNDIHDYRNGLDRTVTPVSGGLVRGLITVPQAWRAVMTLFASGSAVGLAICRLTSWKLLPIGLAGVALGWFYSHGHKKSLKFLSLGDGAVFLGFGALGSLGSWLVQTREFSFLPIVWSLPVSLLIVAIVHANNWRDSRSDLAGGVRTVANRLGDQGAMRYYGLLIFTPFVILLTLTTLPAFLDLPTVPPAALSTLLCLPLAIRLYRRARRRHEPARSADFVTLDGATAQLNLLFGILYTASLLLDYFLRN